MDEPRLVLPAFDDEQQVVELIRRAQRLLFKYPVAAQAAYRALVAEGRRYAATDEGRAWQARLEASPALRRCRPLWEAATLNVLDPSADAIPETLIDLVAHALSRADLEAMIAELTERSHSREQP